MPRLLILCRRPYRLRVEEAEAWLTEQLEELLRRDGLDAATLTGLKDACESTTREWDWLIELQLDDRAFAVALGRGGACGELLADLRLLGMTPMAALAGERKTIEARPA